MFTGRWCDVCIIQQELKGRGELFHACIISLACVSQLLVLRLSLELYNCFSVSENKIFH